VTTAADKKNIYKWIKTNAINSRPQFYCISTARIVPHCSPDLNRNPVPAMHLVINWSRITEQQQLFASLFVPGHSTIGRECETFSCGEWRATLA
jgi:hypothetical protein